MNVELSTVRKLRLTDLMVEPYKLDPVSVILEDLGPSRGKIIIECFGESWSSFWPAMGRRDIATFFCRCDEHYIAKKLSSVSGAIPNYDGLAKKARKEVFCLRRDGDLSKVEARELFDQCHKLEEVEGADQIDGFLMQEVFGDDWWYCIPEKPNPKYQYLCRVIKAVQSGIKAAGLVEQKEQAA
jgi:hypothetical protein